MVVPAIKDARLTKDDNDDIELNEKFYTIVFVEKKIYIFIFIYL